MKIRAAVLHQMGKERPYNESKPLLIEEVELKNLKKVSYRLRYMQRDYAIRIYQ